MEQHLTEEEESWATTLDRGCSQLHEGDWSVGQATLMQLREVASRPYRMCARILHRASNAAVYHFHAIALMRHFLIREWHDLNHQERIQIRDLLIAYSLEHGGTLPSHVLNAALQTVCVALKRGWINHEDESANWLLATVSSWLYCIGSGEEGVRSRPLVALALCEAVLSEFHAGHTEVGMSWEEHHVAQCSLEARVLCSLFAGLCGWIQQHGPSLLVDIQKQLEIGNSRPHTLLLFEKGVAVIEHILRWPFVGAGGSPSKSKITMAPVYVFSSGESEARTRLRPGSKWRSILLDSPSWSVPRLLLSTYIAIRPYRLGPLSRLLRLCLLLLASLDGNIFPIEDQEAIRRAYVERALLEPGLQFLLETLVLTDADDEFGGAEALDVLQIVARLVDTFTWRSLRQVSASRLRAILQLLAESTCALLPAQHRSYALDTHLSEALDVALHCWVSLINQAELSADRKNAIEDLYELGKFTFPILEQFLMSSISPSSISVVLKERLADAGDEQFEDESHFADQMDALALLGRQHASWSLRTVPQVLGACVSKLEERLQSPSYITESCDENETEVLHEQCFWLLELLGSIIADPAEGESPQIPPAICDSSRSSIQAGEDIVLLAMKPLFRLSAITVGVVSNGDSDSVLSPLVVRALVSALQRWSATYLLLSTHPAIIQQHATIPIVERWSIVSSDAASIVDDLARLAAVCLLHWPDEWALARSCSSLLATLASRCRELLAASPSIRELERAISSGQLLGLPTHAMQPVRSIYFTLALWEVSCIMVQLARVIASVVASSGPSSRERFNGLIAPIFARFESANSDRKSLNDPRIVAELQASFDILRGIASVNERQSFEIANDALQPFLAVSPRLVDTFESYPALISDTFGVLREIADVYLVYMDQTQARNFLEACVSCVNAYTAVAQQRVAQHQIQKQQDEDTEQRIADVEQLLDLLAAISVKDMFELDQTAVSLAGHAVSAGLLQLLPLIPASYKSSAPPPRICSLLYELLEQALSTYPAHCASIPAVVDALQFALSNSHLFSPVDRVPQHALAALVALAKHPNWQEKIDLFFHPILNQLVVDPALDSALLDPLADALEAIAGARPNVLLHVIDQLIQSASPQHQVRLSAASNKLVSALSPEGTDEPSAAALKNRRNRFEARHSIHSFVREVRSFMHLK